jgi:hypothetical protein
MCWDVESAARCDPDEPFRPFSCECSPPEDAVKDEFPKYLSFRAEECAPTANAWIYLANDGLRIAFAGDRSSRRIADAPWGPMTWFAVSPDATQLVMNGPPRSPRRWTWFRRLQDWLDPERAGKYDMAKAETFVVDVTDGRVIACWPSPYVDQYRFSPDGRSLAVLAADRTTFYDVPFHEPLLQRLGIGLGTGIVVFVLSRAVLSAGSLFIRLRGAVPPSQ